MSNRNDILNNFLLTDKRDPAYLISNSVKLMIPIYNLITNVDYFSFINNQSDLLNLKLNSALESSIESTILKEQKLDEKIDSILNNLELYFSQAKIDNIKNNSLQKTKIVESLTKEYTNKLKYINYLSKEAKKRENEEGTWLLHICHYFVKGTLSDGSTIKSPLILIPVKIKSSDGKLVLVRKNTPIFNEKLNLILENTYGIKVNYIFEEKSKSHNMESISQILNTYKDVFSSLNVVFEITNEVKKFVFDNEDTLIKIKKLEIDKSICLALIDSSGGKLKQDYIEIIKRNENPFQTYSIIHNNDSNLRNTVENDELLEFSGKLNLYQKLAISSSLNDNCIINGPPGTGKSEVISSIIINAINNNKTCLVISEKMAALDVINNRLKKLSNLCLSLYDDTNSSIIFEKINKFQELLIQSRNSQFKQIELSNFQEKYKNLKEQFEILNKLSNIKIYEFGYDDIINYLNINNNFLSDENKDVFIEINKIIEDNDLTINSMHQIYLELKNLSEKYSKILPLFVNNKFKSFKLNELRTFIKKYNDKNAKTLLWNYISKQKPQTFSFFGFKKPNKLLIDLEQVHKLIIDLEQIRIKEVSLFLLMKIAILNFDHKEFVQGIIELNIFTKNKNKSQTLLQSSFDEYVDSKMNFCENIDSIILNNYLINFQKLYMNLSKTERNDIDNLFAQAKMKKRTKANHFTSVNYEKLKLIFPIWLSNPSNAAIVLPNKSSIFDYGIFDEASQVFLERAFPIIYRSKNNIISGDEKQLRPSNFFSSRYELNDSSSLDNAESLLERAKLCLWPNFTLKNHYRCKNGDLISFSSKNFYDNQLEYISENGDFYPGIKVFTINGLWENDVNKDESKKAIDLLLENNDKFDSIMVISINKKQNDLIEKEFLKKAIKIDELYNKYKSQKIVFKNIENCQGAEADLVIFSIAYGFNKDLKMTNYFGPISQKGGSNRLNVAITRAKQRMFVIKSFKSNDLKLNLENNDSTIFYNFINFLDNLPKIEIQKESNNNELSPYINDVIAYIKSKIGPNDNIEYLYNLNVGNIIIDFTVLNKETNTIIFGINFNKTFIKDDLSKTIDSLFRTMYLYDRGYNIVDVNAIEWYFKNNSILELLNKHIKMVP